MLSEKEIKKGLDKSLADGGAVAARDAITTNFTTPYALALGAGNEQIGIIMALPTLVATLSSPISGKLIETAGSKKLFATKSWLLSHLTWLPVALLPSIFLDGTLVALVVLLCIAHVFGSAGSTAWASWMAELVPEKIRGKFFGKRNTIAGISAFLATLIAGWLLTTYQGFQGFAVIFTLAAFFGIVSYTLLRGIPEPTAQERKGHHAFSLHLSEFLQNFKEHHNFANMTFLTAAVNFSVFIAAPFFTVYMLRDLGISYAWFAIIVAAEVLVAILANKYWGKLADKFGDKAIMGASGLLVSMVPIPYMFSTNQYHLILAGALSGFAWAGYDLTRFNYLLDAVPAEHRPTYIANHKLIAGLAIFVALFSGGFLAAYLSNQTFFFLAGLQILFLMSSVLRLVSITLFFPRFVEKRVKAPLGTPVRYVFWRAVAVYPARGLVHDLDIAYHKLHALESKVKGRIRV